jgi:hypothetical protein
MEGRVFIAEGGQDSEKNKSMTVAKRFVIYARSFVSSCREFHFFERRARGKRHPAKSKAHPVAQNATRVGHPGGTRQCAYLQGVEFLDNGGRVA